MRFLFILPNLRGGGAERAIINFADGLVERGHQSQIVLLQDVVAYAVPNAIKVHALPRQEIFSSATWAGKLLAAWRLRRLHNRLTHVEKFDIIISTLPLADEIVHLAGLPNTWCRIANTLSAELAARSNKLKAARHYSRYRKLYNGQRLIAVSEGVANDLRAQMGFSDAQIVTIYNPFDFGQIRRCAQSNEIDLPNDPFFVHAGRFQRQKRHDVLFDAFKAAELPHRLVLLTDRSDELMQLISSRQLEQRVIVAGFQQNPFPWYANATALVLTSDREGMPNVLVEALICGTPVISTDCPSGPGEILGRYMNHWLVQPGDIGTIAARMREVAHSRPAIVPAVLDRFSKELSLDALEALARRSSISPDRTTPVSS
jgi:glycosyltransferase involved in cell wall biosynthesis